MGRFALPEERPPGLDAPLTAKLIRLGSKAQARVFRLTNGRIGRKWRIGAGFKKPVPTLLLRHVGRKSGKHFHTPLVYLEDGANIVVVASQGGLPSNPQWYRNLLATPEVWIDLPGERGRPVRAHEADAAEKAALWPKLIDLYADFDKYDAWTERSIPVLVLEPR